MRSLVLIPVVVLAVACGSAPKAPPGPTILSGTAALSTFAAAPSSVTATDEGGRTVRADLAADGGFKLSLQRGHTYMLAMATPKGDVAVVFPRTTGKLDKSFVLKSDGALVRLGMVRYLAKAPAGGFHATSAAGGIQTKSEQPGAGDCVDCVNDDQNTTCESDGEGGDESKGSESESKSSAEAKTPEVDTAEQADPNQEMAVGDQNAPDQVDGCGGDGADGDTTQQEGDHTDPGDAPGAP
jgi:hypothetical protein